MRLTRDEATQEQRWNNSESSEVYPCEKAENKSLCQKRDSKTFSRMFLAVPLRTGSFLVSD